MHCLVTAGGIYLILHDEHQFAMNISYALIVIIAAHFVYSRWDGMVERLTIFDDEERQVVSEIRESFQRRKDKLRERRVYPQKVRECADYIL